MRPLRFHFACLVAILLLAGCATQPQQPKPPRGGSLVVKGELTEQGTAVRDRGAEFYKDHRDVEAYTEWRKLADQGHGESLFNMGIMTRDGLGVPADPKAGLEWMRKAADAGYNFAYFDVGAAYSAGTLVPKNVDEAVRQWRKGAEIGCVKCATAAGRYLVIGIDGATKDRTRGIALLTQAAEAEQPDAEAQTALGVMYIDGKYVHNDFAKARALLEKAAAANCECSGSAQYHLGLIYDNGYGVPADKTKAIGYYVQAAAKDYPSALNNLGYAYRHGEGVKKDLTKATAYFAQAAELGDLDATINLGDMTFKGWGTKRDRAKAVELYRKAAEAGAPVGQCRMSQALTHGDGIARDTTNAMEWDLKARHQAPGLRCNERLDDILK
jgi:TPR repeat protein